MTPSQLEKMGIVKSPRKHNPNRYWSNVAQSYLTIPKNATMEEVVTMLFNLGMEIGINEGKSLRSQEIRTLLNC